MEVGAINVEGNYCRVAMFDFNYGKLEAVSESRNEPLVYCHKFIGLSPLGWGHIIHYLDSIYAWKDKNFRSDKVQDITRDVPENETILGLIDF